MNWLPALSLALASYVLGGVSAGYWLVRWRTGGDVREQGSGATGATNVGRVLGPSGFVLTLLFDAGKAAFAVLAARQLELGELAEHACALAVLAGHVWPAQLRFRGGKGVAPLLGAWLVLQPLALLPVAVLTLLAWLALRRFVLAGLLGLCVLPPFAVVFGDGALAPVGATLALLILGWAHRDVIGHRSRASAPRGEPR